MTIAYPAGAAHIAKPIGRIGELKEDLAFKDAQIEQLQLTNSALSTVLRAVMEQSDSYVAEIARLKRKQKDA